MSSNYTLGSAPVPKAPLFSFVRVDLRPDLGVCAVLASSEEGGVLLMPNVTPVDVDAYEVIGEPKPLWIDAGLIYGVHWRSKQFREDWEATMEKYR